MRRGGCRTRKGQREAGGQDADAHVAGAPEVQEKVEGSGVMNKSRCETGTTY
jgi:hypothetical protein